ncbi:MAG: hypothetical protein AB1649_18460, partial [Chloroflexota bacterium]
TWIMLDAQRRAHASKPTPAPLRIANTLFSARLPKFKLPPSTMEYAVTISASLAHYFLEKRRTVGFLASSHTPIVLAADRSERQENKILETLAFLEADGPEQVASFAETQIGQIPQGSNVIIITPAVQTELLTAIDDMRQQRLRPMVILLIAESFGGLPGSDKILAGLAERRTPVCPIHCDADLSAALSGFAAQAAQEAMIWQRQKPPS